MQNVHIYHYFQLSTTRDCGKGVEQESKQEHSWNLLVDNYACFMCQVFVTWRFNTTMEAFKVHNL